MDDKIHKLEMFQEVAKEKISKLSHENEKKYKECVTLEARVVELSNKLVHWKMK